MDKWRLVFIKPPMVKNDRARLRYRIRNYLVTESRKPLPCAADRACLVAVLPNAVAMPVSANHDLRDRFASSSP